MNRFVLAWFSFCLLFVIGCRSASPPLIVADPPAECDASPSGVGATTRDVVIGLASWYGQPYHGRRTANGEVYDMNMLTAAHRTWPFHTLVRVTHLGNNRQVLVRINDRGPFVEEREIDLSCEAARRLDMINTGTARVRLERLSAQEAEKLGAIELLPPQVETRPDEALGDPTVRFVLQLGAFSSENNARRLETKLNGELDWMPVRVDFDGKLYRVISQTCYGEPEGERLLTRLKEGGWEAILKVCQSIDNPS